MSVDEIIMGAILNYSSELKLLHDSFWECLRESGSYEKALVFVIDEVHEILPSVVLITEKFEIIFSTEEGLKLLEMENLKNGDFTISISRVREAPVS